MGIQHEQRNLPGLGSSELSFLENRPNLIFERRFQLFYLLLRVVRIQDREIFFFVFLVNLFILIMAMIIIIIIIIIIGHAFFFSS